MDASISRSVNWFDDHLSEQARAWLVPLIVGALIYAIVLYAARKLLNDPDTLWHIVVGRWIVEHRALPYHDPFSYTFRNGTWVPHEWLAEIGFAALYEWLGWGGVVAATTLATATAFALLTRALQNSFIPRRAAIGALLAFFLTEEHLLARPHVLALPLLVIWMSAVVRARDNGRVPSLALLPVMILWSNLHSGVVAGLLFAGLLAAEAVVAAAASARWQTIRGWGFFLTLSALAALVSPNGVELFALPLRMLRMGFAISAISEWQAVDFQSVQPVELWIALALVAGFSLGLRLPWTRMAMILLLLHLALTHVRNVELLGIVGTLLVAAPFGAQLGSAAGSRDRAPAGPATRGTALSRIGAAAVMSVAIAVAFVSTALALDRRGISPPGRIAPAAAVAAARTANLTGHVLNAYGFGGYLIFAGIPTFIDGRADLFGDAFLKRYTEAIAAIDNALPELVDRYDVEWTLLAPSMPAVSLLDHMPGWERVYTDEYAVLHRRKMPSSTRAVPAAPRDDHPQG
jgi:hypothetical protein